MTEKTSKRPIERLDHIRKRLNRDGEVLIAELAGDLGVSEMTVRRDLERLEAGGEVIRTHGGAAAARRLNFAITFRAGQQRHLEQKKAIAARALAHIQDGQVIFLDTGTTCLEVARAIAGRRAVTVITTSLANASELQFVEQVETILLGGFLRHGSPDIHGPLTEQNLSQFKYDLAVVGADGIEPDGCTFTDDLRILSIDRMVARLAEQTVVVADSSKFGRHSMCKVFSAADYHVLITDEAVAAETARRLARHSVHLEKALKA